MSKGTERFEASAFTIEAGKVTRQSASSSRTRLSFEASSVRHFDGGYEVNVSAMLFDARGRFIGRRRGDSHRTILGARAAWSHEIDNVWIAQAATVTYEIECRFVYQRTIVAGELPELADDASDYQRWLNLDPRALEDRIARFDFALWARTSELAITCSQQPKFTTDTCRTELELDLLDGAHQLCFSRCFSIGMNCGHPAYDDTSLDMDRHAQRSLRFFELRGRTEARSIDRLTAALPAKATEIEVGGRSAETTEVGGGHRGGGYRG